VKACAIDAAVILAPDSNRLSLSGTRITRNSLEAAGVPVFTISADMVDAREWKHDNMVEAVSSFLADRGVGGT